MALSNLKKLLAVCCLVVLVPITSHVLPAGATESATVTAAKETAELNTEDSEGVEGIASYYAKRYNGRRTNSGKRHNPEKLTAAHPSLPHGTRVKVINLANDREVIVTINDRCRARKQPFIDLSRAAARELGFLGKGKARVRIVTLEEG